MFNRLERQFTIWIAVAVLLMSALAPAVSHAIASWEGTSTSWQQICTAQADKSEPATGSPGSPVDDEIAAHFDHCPYCSLDQSPSAPPPQHVPPVISPGDQGVDHSRDLLPLHLRLPWSSAQQRAPPLHC
ncbi:DUF2946 domain-containing protein [Polaromonas jejuensis]|uniref:DUF2946 domain-containing protein n=1 Tax=Polaromonas jejuensis TaxID=457502 RepID=A0ABW0Q4V7_9BURK